MIQQSPTAPQGQDKPVRSQEHDQPPAAATALLRLRGGGHPVEKLLGCSSLVHLYNEGVLILVYTPQNRLRLSKPLGGGRGGGGGGVGGGIFALNRHALPLGLDRRAQAPHQSRGREQWHLDGDNQLAREVS